MCVLTAKTLVLCVCVYWHKDLWPLCVYWQQRPWSYVCVYWHKDLCPLCVYWQQRLVCVCVCVWVCVCSAIPFLLSPSVLPPPPPPTYSLSLSLCLSVCLSVSNDDLTPQQHCAMLMSLQCNCCLKSFLCCRRGSWRLVACLLVPRWRKEQLTRRKGAMHNRN